MYIFTLFIKPVLIHNGNSSTSIPIEALLISQPPVTCGTSHVRYNQANDLDLCLIAMSAIGHRDCTAECSWFKMI